MWILNGTYIRISINKEVLLLHIGIYLSSIFNLFVLKAITINVIAINIFETIFYFDLLKNLGYCRFGSPACLTCFYCFACLMCGMSLLTALLRIHLLITFLLQDVFVTHLLVCLCSSENREIAFRILIDLVPIIKEITTIYPSYRVLFVVI